MTSVSGCGQVLRLLSLGLLLGLLAYISFGLNARLFPREVTLMSPVSYFCVVMMSISGLFYIIGGQYLIGKFLHLVPISGYDTGFNAIKFTVLPSSGRTRNRGHWCEHSLVSHYLPRRDGERLCPYCQGQRLVCNESSRIIPPRAHEWIDSYTDWRCGCNVTQPVSWAA